jgi:drug/metabolite transporter (DMT)-like permease
MLTLTVLFWSGNFVLGRGIRELIPPVGLNFWRWTGALIILLPFGLPRIRKQKELIFQHWKFLMLMSIPSIAIFNAFIYTALQSATAMNTVLVNAMVPVFIAVLAWAIFRDRMSPRQVVGVLISMTGLVFIITRGDFSVLWTLDFSEGDLWTLGAGVSWAVYSVMLRKRPPKLDLIAFLTVIVIFGLIVLAPFYIWELFEKGGFQLKPASYASIAYVCIFPSVLAYIFWNRAVLAVGPNQAGIFFHLMPVFSILLASLFLGESLFLYHLTGMALIFTGIALTTAPKRPFRRNTP